MSVTSKLGRKHVIRLAQGILLIVAYFAVNLAGKGFDESPLNLFLVEVGIAAASFSFLGVLILFFWSRKTMPKETKKVVTRASSEWEKDFFVHFDLALPLVFIGILTESLLVSVSSWLILVAPSYLAATFVLYRNTRDRKPSDPWTSLTSFFVAATSIPFSVLALKDPQLLSRVFTSFGITLPISQEISLLLVLWMQFALMLSTALLLGQAWRTRELLSHGLSVTDLKDRYDLVVEAVCGEQWINEFIEIFSATKRLLPLFERGDFSTLVALGWGMLDRGLGIVSSQRHIRERALDIGVSASEFNLAYQARTEMAHKGKAPTHHDAINFLVLLKHVFEKIADPDRERVKRAPSPI